MLFKDNRKYIEYLTIFFVGVIITYLIISHLPNMQGMVNHLFAILTPFYIGFGIAYILNRPITYIQNRFKLKRGYVIAGTYLTLIAFITTFISLMLPQIIGSSVRLVTDITAWVSTQNLNLTQYNLGPVESILQDNINKIAEFLSTFSNILIENLTKFLLAVSSALMTTIFGIIISIYMLADKRKMIDLGKQVINAFFNNKRSNRILEFAGNVNNIFSHFMSGLIVEALIVGSLAFIGMSILGVRYALILAVIICFTNVIPYIGPFIGAVPAVIATLTYDPIKALWVLLFILVLQQFDGNFIGPRVMGNYIGLAPIWIILSITIGGGFAGILGVILAIPTGAILKKIVFSELLEKTRSSKNRCHH